MSLLASLWTAAVPMREGPAVGMDAPGERQRRVGACPLSPPPAQRRHRGGDRRLGSPTSGSCARTFTRTTGRHLNRLDFRQRTLRRTEVLRPRGLAYEADQASRRPAPRAAPTRQTPSRAPNAPRRPGALTRAALTPRPPYE